MRTNPFTLDFGAKPNLFIPRIEEQNRIINTFTAETPSTHIYLLIGARGTGKTVLMTSIAHELKEDHGWLHVDLSMGGDMLNLLATCLYQNKKGGSPKVDFDISVKGVGVSVSKNEKYSDVYADLDVMLRSITEKNQRLIVTLDEAANTADIRNIMMYFQHCIREQYNFFILATGLYKNIRSLQNNKTMTFLKRVPKIVLKPLNLLRIAQKYSEVFDIDRDSALNIARKTDGYSYGFQILGYTIFDAGKNEADDSVLIEYEANLEDCSYEKIWEELSDEERRVVTAIAKADSDVSVKKLRDDLDMDSNAFSTYKNTLEKSGILSDNSAYGKTGFCLPYFREFVLRLSGE